MRTIHHRAISALTVSQRLLNIDPLVIDWFDSPYNDLRGLQSLILSDTHRTDYMAVSRQWVLWKNDQWIEP